METKKLVHCHTGVTLRYGAKIRVNAEAKIGGRIETATIIGIAPHRQEIGVNITGDCRDNFWLHCAWCDVSFEDCTRVEDYFYQNQLRA